MRKSLSIFIIYYIISVAPCLSQNIDNQKYWHNKERTLRYQPDGGDFVIINGNHRFNRALYGTNTAFRVEAGDLPEFALYMPGMGGNFRFGLMTANGSKWLIKADKIIARYRPGSMIYNITDSLLGKGQLLITVLAMADAEGAVVKAEFIDVPEKTNLFWAFGGASGGKFSRDGDLNVDPESSFYLKPENCKTDMFEIQNNSFTMYYGGGKVLSESERYEIQYPNAKPAPDSSQNKSKENKKQLIGLVPPGSLIKVADANQLEAPFKLLESQGTSMPVMAGKIEATSGKELYFIIQNPEGTAKLPLDYADAPKLFDKAEASRKVLAGRIKVETPDPYINTLGGTLGIAADAIWEYPTFLHGAIGWRMRLNGWRGPYTGDPLGWHDRSRTHFNAYAKSQVLKPDSGPSVPDPDKNLARQEEKMGNALYTSGYICRNPDGKLSPHHYDMNLVFIDALLRHFYWTGDLAYVKEMWPLLKRHLAWEKRNFDGDNDGLYDAYCCIWASDALEYSGGGVTHSSAYNYLAFKTAAYLAGLISEDPEPYRKEAEKILNAMNTKLWMPANGWFAEYQDFFGLKRLHPAAALWTIYHTIDSKVPDPFQAYQMTRYVDAEIPHIPVVAKGLQDNGYYVLSTSSWMPYTWSINNVVMAENLHTALAYWQSGRGDDAFKIWKSTLLDAMYLGSSPGNFVQVEFYDAARGESYRDFADEIGMTSRLLVEGLFGITPNALDGTLTIQPGLPVAWDHAALKIPDFAFDFRRKGNQETYTITQAFAKPMKIKFLAKAFSESVKSVTINGKSVAWTNISAAIEYPQIEVDAGPAANATIVIEWQGNKPEMADVNKTYAKNEILTTSFAKAKMLEVFDPQKTLQGADIKDNKLKATVVGGNGSRTAFVKLSQGQFTWWAPLCFEVRNSLDIVAPVEQKKNSLKFNVLNNTSVSVICKVTVNPGINAYSTNITIKPAILSDEISIPSDKILCGSNLVRVEWGKGNVAEEQVINWDVDSPKLKWETVNLTSSFNDKVTSIFTNKYLSPRSPYPTLSIPIQGIGNWCYTMTMANIDDSGLRKSAGAKNQITTPQGIPFATPGQPDEKNIVFTSLWDNYPAATSIPLTGSASHAYFLMAGSTNPMQSQLSNGEVIIEYTDGSHTSLDLRNPETWWPIEQDYMVDGYAFSLKKPKPIRVHLKTGLMTRDFNAYTTLKGFSTYAIDGGAATIFDLPLDSSRKLKNLILKTLSTEVVVGLMGVTLVRKD